MTTFTPRLDLPFIEAAQAQKHVTHNAALERLDVITQLTVQAFDAVTPPAAALEGQVWALGATPTGVWAGHNNGLAAYVGGGWFFVTPRNGWRAWGLTTGTLRVWQNNSWVSATPAQQLENLPGVGINASSDSNNRLVVSSPAVLFNHSGAGHQVKINKAAAANTASLLYQTGFSGRAEMGLAGNDDFALKVSADGGTWRAALTVGAATGAVDIGQFMRLTPGTAPASPTAGMVYYDAALNKARCYDGTAWKNLF